MTPSQRARAGPRPWPDPGSRGGAALRAGADDDLRLASAAGRPCIDAIPIREHTNEVGHFQTAFRSLIETCGGLFDLVSYDAVGFSRANADAVVAAGKDYIFALEDVHRTMFRLAEELLATEPVVDCTGDRLDRATTVVRPLELLAADPRWSRGREGPEHLDLAAGQGLPPWST